MNKRARQLHKARPDTRHALVLAPQTLAEQLEHRMLLSAALSWVPGPSHLAVAPDNAVWFANTNTLTRRAPDGAVNIYTLPSTGSASAEVTSDIVFTPDASAWFVISDQQGSRIEHLTADGEFESITANTSRIWDLTTTADGRLWYTQGSNLLAMLTPGSATNYVQIPNVWGLSDLTAGADGRIWFAGDRYGGGGVAGNISTLGQITTFPLDGLPSDLAALSDGSVYLGGNDAIWHITAGGALTRTALPGVTALDLVTTPGGDLWFIDNRDALNPLSRLSANGDLDQFAIDSIAGAKVTSLAFDADGTLWYTGATTSGTSQVDLFGHLPSTSFLGHSNQLYPIYKRLFNGAVASFEDPLATSATTGDSYTATIDWGDGSSSNASVVRNNKGGFDILGSHAYAVFDWHVLTIHIADASGPRALTISSAAYIPPPLPDQPQPVVAVQAGIPFSGVVARYSALDPAAIGSYKVTINWGDGSSSAGMLSLDDDGAILITGQHTYSRTATFSVSTSLKDTRMTLPGYWGNPTAAVRIYRTYAGNQTILVGSASNFAFASASTPIEISPQTSLQLSGRTLSGIAGAFTVHNASGAGGDARVSYTALIDWGDGHVSQGVLDAAGGGTFNVTGSHTYSGDGSYQIRLVVRRTQRDLPAIQTESVSDFAFRPTGFWSPAGTVVTASTFGSSAASLLTLAVTNSFPDVSRVSVNVPNFSSGGALTAIDYQRNVGGIRIMTTSTDGNSNGSGGEIQKPPPPPPPHVTVVVQTPPGAATFAAAAPTTAPATRPGLTTAAVRKVSTFTTVRTHSYTYAVPPAGSVGDPGQFSGEFGVVEGPVLPAGEALPRDGSEHYDGSRRTPQPPREGDASATAGSTAPHAAAQSIPEEPGTSLTISTAAAPAIDVPAAEEEMPAPPQVVAAAAVSGEVLSAADLPMTGSQSAVGGWWKVAAILGTGAALQVWHWRRIMKVRWRQHP